MTDLKILRCEDCGEEDRDSVSETNEGILCYGCYYLRGYDLFYHWDLPSLPSLEDHSCFSFLYS